jgi:hypothetical protein
MVMIDWEPSCLSRVVGVSVASLTEMILGGAIPHVWHQRHGQTPLCLYATRQRKQELEKDQVGGGGRQVMKDGEIVS